MNIITIDGKDIEITEQMVFDAYMMSLPEFVTYYRISNELPIISEGGTSGVRLRDLYFSLRDQLSTRDLQVNKQLKKSSLRQWLADRDITIKDMMGRGEMLFHDKPKVRDTPVDEVDELVEQGLSKEVKAACKLHKGYDRKNSPSNPIRVKETQSSKSVEVVKQPKKEEVSIPKGSRLDQVRELITQGITSPKVIAQMLGTNVAYIHTLKGKLKNE